MSTYKKNSLSLTGAVSLGAGVMIGAGIFALLGQVAELSGALFPFIFLIGAVISAFSAYTYIKLSNAYPSAGSFSLYRRIAVSNKARPLPSFFAFAEIDRLFQKLCFCEF